LPATPPVFDVAPGHVLVIEDQPYDRDLLVRVLQGAGHRVTTAASGPAGLARLEDAAPDVVLCDVVMPGMDGLAFCRAVKGRPNSPFVPVLLVTGRTQPDDLLAGFEAGADDYIAKPINFDELKARVRTMLRIRRLQGGLEAQRAKLQQANRDMEEFLHAVSHDLRAPLISLTGLAASLARDHAAALGEAGRTALSRLQQQVASMAALVNHLVEFARLGNAPHRPRAMPLGPLVDQACANVSAAIEAARACVEIAPDWPTGFCDPVGICQVLQNLVGNAVKFMGPQPHPRVQIGHETTGPELKIWVRDNGVGIPAEKLREVFRLFARLGQINADGLGVGLSTAERIVERHGGRIWIESQPGVGTTVFFTVPKA
jgi:signal transduction histidine kinase